MNQPCNPGGRRTRLTYLALPLALSLAACSSDNGSTANTNTTASAAATDNALVRQIEHLDRGLVAVPGPEGILVSWRRLYGDSEPLGFSLYRNGEQVATLDNHTNYLDPQGSPGDNYALHLNQQPVASTQAWQQGYLEIPLSPPPDGVTPDGETYSYTANDASVGDLTGDGRYEIILKWDPTNARDNAHGGYTGNAIIDAYTLEGEKLWRIDLGRNIRAGAHYTQFMVYDFNGDGIAEIAMKTADGTVDGQGNVIGDPDADWVSHGGKTEVRDRTGSVVTPDGRFLGQLRGRILTGPEYFSVFDGRTGRVLDTVPYIPQRAPGNDNPSIEEMKDIWGDGYGNRSERYLAGVAYLDGERPSVIMARGYYARTVVAAYDFRDGKISTRWVFDSSAPGMPPKFGGQGNHQLSIADIDGDGKDEIIYGAMAIDHDGSPKWTTGLGHGDALHVSNLNPENPGLEAFGVYESMRDSGGIGSAMLRLSDGKILWSTPADSDVGRGVAIDIDPRHPGTEVWASNSNNLYNARGEVIADTRPRQMNFAVWWDGDLLREILDGITISKWDWHTNTTVPLLEATGTRSNNGTKATPALSADILGDWREEVILRAEDNRSLRIYSTPIPTEHSMTTLMHDTQYRVAIAWQNTSYNQPPHPSFFLGHGMDTPPNPPRRIVKAD